MADAPRKRRWPWYLAVCVALLAAAGLWINHQLEPHRLARTVLSALGESQGLEISFDGEPSYVLRPEPRLVLPNVVARQPGAATPLLTAARVEVSLPWDTITGGDDKVVITRIELDRPALDLAALSAWRASRPATTDFEIPTITRGVHVTDGRLQGGDWQAHGLSLDLARLAAGEPVRLALQGSFVRETISVEAKATLAIEEASGSTPFELQAEGNLLMDGRSLPWRLDAGRCFFRWQEPELGVDCSESDFTGSSPLPSFRAGLLSYGKGRPDGKTMIRMEGTMPEWPGDWPALPEPGSPEIRPTRFELDYLGAADLSDPLSVVLERGETTLDATLVIAQVQDWLADEQRGPVPPLRGSFSAPALVVEGFTLENVRAEIVEPDAASEE